MVDELKSLGGRRILIVEDEYVIAVEMEHWLQTCGADVEGPWPSVEQAMAALDRSGSTIDAGVLDIDLGFGKVAYPVAERLDSLGVPYLFATGNIIDLDNPAFQGHPILEKPVSARVLQQAVRNLLIDRPRRP